MEVPISYFDPNNGQTQNLEQRCNELFDSGVSEITISELGKTYTSEPVQITQLMNDVTKYYESTNIGSDHNRELKVTATVVTDDDVVTKDGNINISELIKLEKATQGFKDFMQFIGFILCTISLIWGIDRLCNSDWVMGATMTILAIGLFVHIRVTNNILSHLMEISNAVKWLYNRKTQE